MTTATIIETDLRLRDAVLHQLDWDPRVDASALRVSASGGIVTLTGFIDTYAGKLAAERAVKRVRGVRAVANDVVVRLSQPRIDEEIARDAADAIAAGPESLREAVQIVVHHGHITLTGRVEWLFQRQVPEDLVRHVRGVVDVHNHITVTPRAASRDVKQRITRALHHAADVDARQIEVTIAGDTVTLTGTVGSWAERDAAEQAAGHAPGITRVDNRVVVASEVRPEAVDEIC